jgi:hypothetical protein
MSMCMSSQACAVMKGRYQSGQLGQTVNLLSDDFVGSNPALPTLTVLDIKALYPEVGSPGAGDKYKRE